MLRVWEKDIAMDTQLSVEAEANLKVVSLLHIFSQTLSSALSDIQIWQLLQLHGL